MSTYLGLYILLEVIHPDRPDEMIAQAPSKAGDVVLDLRSSPEGPSTQYLRLLGPTTIPLTVVFRDQRA